jgi:hypothetical protein
MPYQAAGPLGWPSLDPTLDLMSPPLSCTEVGTIWSQAGNSYTQIVDLADVDNSRSILPPGISEDPASPYYTNQVALWVQGATHPAPLSRAKVEQAAAARKTLARAAYAGPDSAPSKLAVREDEPGVRFIAAIPKAEPGSGGQPAQPLPGRKPDDPQLEAGLRYLIRPERTAEEADAKIGELKAYVRGNLDLARQLIGGLELVLHLRYGTSEAQEKMRVLLDDLRPRRAP